MPDDTRTCPTCDCTVCHPYCVAYRDWRDTGNRFALLCATVGLVISAPPRATTTDHEGLTDE